MLASVRDANASGAARRRQRRLIQWPRHERLSVAVAQYFTLDDDEKVLAARPLALDEQRPQVRVLRRTVEQIGDVDPLVPALADSVPHMVDHLVAVLARYDMPIAGQVIEVPKVSCPPGCARTVLRTPQTAGQLVKMPTILYFLKQTVDTRGRSGGPQGFLPGRVLPPLPSRSWTFQLQVVVHWEVFQVSQGQSLLQRTVDQTVDIPVPRGRLQGTLPEQGSTAVRRDGGPRGGLQRLLPEQVSTAVPRDGGLHDSLPDQGSTAFFGVTGPQGFVPGQSSTAIRRDEGPCGGADDVDDLIRRSQELLEYTRRESSFSSEEEETEQMDLEEQPSRFQGHFRPRRCCASNVVSAGGARRALSRTRTTSSTRMCRDTGDGPCVHAALVPEVRPVLFSERCLSFSS